MNLLCAVNVSQQPEGSLPDIQSAEEAIKMLKQFQANSSQQVNRRMHSVGAGCVARN